MSTPAEAVKPRIIDRIIGPSPTELAKDAQLAAVEEMFTQFRDKHENWMIDMGENGVSSMHEALGQIDMMLDAQGWTSVWEYDDDRGLTLRQIKEASRQLRELRVGNPFVANGYRIRNAQTWGGGVELGCRLRTGKRDFKPLSPDYQRLVDSYWGQRYVFGNKARGELESAAFTDGVVLFLGRDSDKQIQRIQIQEITGLLHNPNNSEEVWAYRRQWNADPENPNAAEGLRTRWYYTDAVPRSERRRTIRVRGGDTEVAEPEYTMIDSHFNRQIGWSLGVPDALCIVAWARLYKEFLVNGYVMSRSLARLAYKITVASAAAGNKSATTVATPGQAGSTYLEGAGNSLTPLATAGKGYDFGSAASLGAAMAAGLGVSWLALTANPAAAAGSNAAAQSLDPIAKATAAVRRKDWEDEFARMFRFFGMERTLVMTWQDLAEDTIARQLQAWTLVDQLEVFGGEVIHREVAKAMQIGDPGQLLAGWKRKSERGAAQSTFGQTGTSPADGRGRDDGSGDSPDDHDDDDT